MSVGVVAAVHLIAIWALASGLASQLLQKPLEELQAEVVREKPPDNPKEPPPPPPDMVKPPPPFVPPPDIAIQADAPVSTNTISVQQKVEVKETGITAPVLSAGKGNNCASRYYPPLAIRLNHEGSTIVTVQVGTDGSVTGVNVATGSGFTELDEAAVKCVQNGWRFKPAMNQGVPVAGSKQYRILWKLNG